MNSGVTQWLQDRRPAEDETGSVTVWMIGVVVASFLMIALLVDGGVMLRQRSDAFGTAGAAARAGAQQLDLAQAVEGRAVLDPIAAERAALDYLAARGMSGNVEIDNDTVTVHVTATATLQMWEMVGGGSVTFEATGSARAVKVVP